jgi:hypothetical protein
LQLIVHWCIISLVNPFSRASTVMRPLPGEFGGGVLDDSRAGLIKTTEAAQL